MERYKGLAEKTGEDQEAITAIGEQLHEGQLIYIQKDGKPVRVRNEAYIVFDNDAKGVTSRNFTYLKDLYPKKEPKKKKK